MISENAKANTVSSKNQLEEDKYVTITKNNGKIKILFVGNSITMHAPSPEIGWYGNWGMAASKEENDYVHKVVKGLTEKYGAVDFCVCQCSEWERNYFDGKNVLEKYYSKSKEFNADVVVIRIGENINRDKNKEINCKIYYDEMIKYFKSCDNKKVIVTDNFWSIPVLDEAFKEVIKENGYTYCKIGDLELDKRTMALGEYEHGGVSAHPGDFGMECIAQRILEKIYEVM